MAPGAALLVRLNALTRPRVAFLCVWCVSIKKKTVTKSQMSVPPTLSPRPGAPHPATVDSLCDITETEAAV